MLAQSYRTKRRTLQSKTGGQPVSVEAEDVVGGLGPSEVLVGRGGLHAPASRTHVVLFQQKLK